VNATSNRQLIIHLGPSVISILMLVYYLLSGLQLKSNGNESLIKLTKPNETNAASLARFFSRRELQQHRIWQN
jgi:hypothetical protein